MGRRMGAEDVGQMGGMVLMGKIERKALHFLTALIDVYRDEDDRELNSLSKLDFDGADFTEDFTAILLALRLFMEKVSDFDADLIDFTHMLNKLAVQYVMDAQKEVAHEQKD